jgi:hypothetical protein
VKDKHGEDSFIEDLGLKTNVEDNKLYETNVVINTNLAGERPNLPFAGHERSNGARFASGVTKGLRRQRARNKLG